MEDKKNEIKDNKLAEEIEKLKSNDEWNDTSSLIGLVLIAGIFGDWGRKSKTAELENRIAKLEGKMEIVEKLSIK